MAVAAHAVGMRTADNPDSTIVAITADGKVYVGVKPAEPAALSNLSGETVYVKVDARVPYQTVLAVLEALRGKSVVLLTASPGNAASQGLVSPYGLKLVLSR
jgi:biopolymer transport protein ExbD